MDTECLAVAAACSGRTQTSHATDDKVEDDWPACETPLSQWLSVKPCAKSYCQAVVVVGWNKRSRYFPHKLPLIPSTDCEVPRTRNPMMKGCRGS